MPIIIYNCSIFWKLYHVKNMIIYEYKKKLVTILSFYGNSILCLGKNVIIVINRKKYYS